MSQEHKAVFVRNVAQSRDSHSKKRLVEKRFQKLIRVVSTKLGCFIQYWLFLKNLFWSVLIFMNRAWRHVETVQLASTFCILYVLVLLRNQSLIIL